MTEFIMKLDFRRVFIEYIVLAITALAIFGGAAACLNRDKIVFALEYISAGVKLNMGASAAEEVDEMANISFETDDVSEIVIVDDSNKVLFSTKDNIAVKGGMFILNETEGKDGFLENSDMPNAVYKAVDKSDFILSSLLPIDLTDISENYRDEFFYEPDFLDKELYLISYMGNGEGNSKIYIINTAAQISEGASSVKIAAAAAVFVFMIYWLITALWVYQNAAKSRLSAPLWGIAVLFTNVIGVIVYALYKRSNCVCPYCGAVQDKGGVFCVACGEKLQTTCENCGKAVGKSDLFCRSCGSRIESKDR